MKILVIGCGLLGKKLFEKLEEQNFEVYGSFFEHPIEKDHCFHLDITKKADVTQSVKKYSPDIIIQTSAMTNVDECETKRNQASNVNVQGTKNVASAAEKQQALLMYISTDYVFDGEQGLYKEDDRVNPINYYGLTKLEGENAVRLLCTRYIIARTSVLYGAQTHNFATWLVQKLGNNEKVTIVQDQFVSPTLNVDLAEQLIALIQSNMLGVFHTAGAERIDRYAFACCIADEFGFDTHLITAGHMKDMKWNARRPKDSSLDISKISKIKTPYSVQHAVRLLHEEIKGKIQKDTLK
jgi:dTDP-4-dehydrorhamnose reductase